MQHSTLDHHQELLDTLVPLCGGLPFALTVMGNVFVDEAKRERAQWKLIQQQMVALNVDNEDTSPVTTSLKLSYDWLLPSRQAAFLDIVSMFYGWPWEKVERIVGVLVTKDLRNSALISQVDGTDMCNQSALRRGYDSDSLYNTSPIEEYNEKVVTMHDLTLRFGESILTNDTHRVEDGFLEENQFASSRLRNLMVGTTRLGPHLHPLKRSESANNCLLSRDTTSSGYESSILDLVKKANNVKMLAFNFDDENFYQATFDKRDTVLSKTRELHYLSLIHCNSIKGDKVSGGVGGKWAFWSKLAVVGCSSIEELPDAICNCVTLEKVEVTGCKRLMRLPRQLGRLSNSKALDLSGCGRLKKLPVSMGDAVALEELALTDCESLQKVPQKLGELKALRHGDVLGCTSLQQPWKAFVSRDTYPGPYIVNIPTLGSRG
ncbi:hypothetical protein L7F22_004907 [Adiantum nelumboides]|nr:hypothetical protein [Adiantum nelumboides]